jgi:hypothetical protein
LVIAMHEETEDGTGFPLTVPHDAGVGHAPAIGERVGGFQIAADAQAGEQVALPDGRSEANDMRCVYHELGHAVMSRMLRAEPIGGVTCDPLEGFEGLCWPAGYEPKDTSVRNTGQVPKLCSKIRGVMPRAGEGRESAAVMYLHCYNRVSELVAGTEAERIFVPGEPWPQEDDDKQAFAYASLVTSSPASTAAFIAACRVEAAALLVAWEYVVHALAIELRIVRRMDGAAVDVVIQRAVAEKVLAIEKARRSEWQRTVENGGNFATSLPK